MRIEQSNRFPDIPHPPFHESVHRISRTRDIRCYGSMTVVTYNASIRAKLLGSPTSIALAMVAMEGRDCIFRSASIDRKYHSGYWPQ